MRLLLLAAALAVALSACVNGGALIGRKAACPSRFVPDGRGGGEFIDIKGDGCG